MRIPEFELTLQAPMELSFRQQCVEGDVMRSSGLGPWEGEGRASGSQSGAADRKQERDAQCATDPSRK